MYREGEGILSYLVSLCTGSSSVIAGRLSTHYKAEKTIVGTNNEEKQEILGHSMSPEFNLQQ